MSGAEADERGVPDLVGDAVRAVLALLRSTARMLRFEARELARGVARRLALLVAAAVVGAAGFVVLLGAAGFFVEHAFGLPRWAAFAVVGSLALLAGAGGVAWAIRRLAQQDLAFPATRAELTLDLHAVGAGESRDAAQPEVNARPEAPQPEEVRT